MLRVKPDQPGESPRHADGSIPERRAWRGRGIVFTGHLRRAVDSGHAAIRGAYQDLIAPSDAVHARLDHRDREAGRHGGVGRVSPDLEHSGAGESGERLRRHHHAVWRAGHLSDALPEGGRRPRSDHEAGKDPLPHAPPADEPWDDPWNGPGASRARVVRHLHSSRSGSAFMAPEGPGTSTPKP